MRVIQRYKRRSGGKVIANGETVSVGWGSGSHLRGYSINVDTVHLTVMDGDGVDIEGSPEEMRRLAERILETCDRHDIYRAKYPRKE
jgi:hypothetical protein